MTEATTRQGPDFVIVGAPKAGTTAMQATLSAHPHIFMARPKEMHHFGSDLAFRFPRPGREEYLAAFPPDHIGPRGEASVWYLYSQKAASEIHAMRPDARIIILLRNPVDLLPSLHSEFLYSGNETITDFAGALAAETDRAEGRKIPRSAYFPQGLLYSKVVRFGPQVARYLDAFGRRQVHVMLQDDLAADPRATIERALHFLGVDAGGAPEVRRVNPNKRIRSVALRNLLMDPPRWVRAGADRILTPRGRRRLARRLQGLNTRHVPRRPLEPTFRAELADRFRPAVEELEAVVARRLDVWKQAPPSATGGAG